MDGKRTHSIKMPERKITEKIKTNKKEMEENRTVRKQTKTRKKGIKKKRFE